MTSQAAKPVRIAVRRANSRSPFSLVDESTGLEITMVRGKRRLAGLLEHLGAQPSQTFQDLRTVAHVWKKANPRPR